MISKHWEASEVTWKNATKTTEWTNLDSNTIYYDNDIEDTVQFPGGGDHFDPCVATSPLANSDERWQKFIITSELKQYLKSPGEFHGLYLKTHFENQGRWYASSEYEEKDKRPKLTFKYKSTGINSHLPIMNGQNSLKISIAAESANIFILRDGYYSVSIMDLKGKLVHSFTGNQKGWISIPRSMLGSGIHIFTVSQKNMLVKKMCIY